MRTQDPEIVRLVRVGNAIQVVPVPWEPPREERRDLLFNPMEGWQYDVRYDVWIKSQ